VEHFASSECRSPCVSPSGPSIVREAWAAHERFPAQALLLRSHASFRAVSHALVEQAGPSGRAGGLRAIERTFEMWMAAMQNHEHYEEHKLYPYLARRYDTSMECLVGQHRSLHGAKRDVRLAFEETDPSLVCDALRAHRRILMRHLDEEEGIVIPMLLELEPREFDAYATLPIELLMRRFPPSPGSGAQ